MAKRKAGRHLIPIDWDRAADLLVKGGNGIQVAATLGISNDILYRRCEKETGHDFASFAAMHREKGNQLIHAKQLEVAMSGNPTMLIWLGKQRMKQVDSPDKTAEFSEEQRKLINELFHQITKLQESTPKPSPDHIRDATDNTKPQ